MQGLRWLVITWFCLSFACERAPAESTPPAAAAEAEQPVAAVGPTRLRGTLLGHDQQPLPLAQIHVELSGEEPTTVEAAVDGSFELTLPGPGWARLRLTGVSHEEQTLEFLAPGGEHELAVALGTYDRPEALEALAGFGRFDGEGERISLGFAKREDGAWAATVARGEDHASAESFHYQLANATSEGRTMNGTRADRYVYDGGGDYFSVVELEPGAGSFDIVFEPAALPPAGRSLALRHGDPESSLARAVSLRETIVAWEEQAFEGFRAAAQEGEVEGEGDLAQLRAEAKAKLRRRYAEAAAAENHPALRRMLLVAWAANLPAPPTHEVGEDSEASGRGDAPKVEEIERALTELGPRDPAWSMEAWALPKALAWVDDPQYFALAAAEHPDPAVGATLWIAALIEADEAGERERGREALKALEAPRFADLPVVRVAKMYSPDRPTAPGRPVPNFSLRSPDGETEYSAAELRGKTYVLDFWATWCGPCIAEMPALHRAYAALNGQPPVEGRDYRPVAEPEFEIISVSFDQDVDAVALFRNEQWPMPWAHAVPDAAAHEQLSEAFGIVGIPTMVLVGPDGTILASSPRLDGGSLGEVAGEFLRSR